MSISGTLRIIDANFNRAREALRVMEEAARFILDDAGLVEQIKSLRHGLSGAMAKLPGLAWHRDTVNDVGTKVQIAGQMRRESVCDVVTAAGKRLSEALRAIEEYGKTLDTTVTLHDGQKAHLAAYVESLRYKGYTLEQQLQTRLGSGRPAQWRLCVLLTQSLCKNGDWLGVADRLSRPDATGKPAADCIQLREKELSGRELLERAKKLADLLKPRAVSLVINDRPDIALLAGADGVHLGQDDLPITQARKLVGRGLIVGVSTSCIEEAKRAREEGADYVGLGPMFPTTTKKKEVIVGPAYLAQFIQTFPGFAHLAIAGINRTNAALLASAGARGVAVSSAVCGSDDPAQSAREIASHFGEHTPDSRDETGHEHAQTD